MLTRLADTSSTRTMYDVAPSTAPHVNVGRMSFTVPPGVYLFGTATEKLAGSLQAPSMPFDVARTQTRYVRPDTSSDVGDQLVPFAAALPNRFVAPVDR